MALPEGIILRLVPEQGVQTLDLRIHADTGTETGFQLGDPHHGSGCCGLVDDLGLLIRRDVHGGTDGGKEVGVLRSDDVLVRQVQGPDEGGPKLRKEVERTSQEGHVAPDGLSAGQAGDGLIHHRLEDGGGQVLPGGPVVDQGLDIGLGEHAASCGNGIDRLIVAGVIVEAAGVRLKQGGHLVDEGTGAAGTDAVHPLIDASGKIDDLGILASKLDGNVTLGRIVRKGRGHRHHLLNEGGPQMTGDAESAGACDRRTEQYLPQLLLRLGKQVRKGGLDIGKMPAVLGKEHLSRLFQDGDLYGGGTDVHPEP